MKMMHSPLRQQSVNIEPSVSIKQRAISFTQVWVEIFAAEDLVLKRFPTDFFSWGTTKIVRDSETSCAPRNSAMK
jgi:hypothetical protein